MWMAIILLIIFILLLNIVKISFGVLSKSITILIVLLFMGIPLLINLYPFFKFWLAVFVLLSIGIFIKAKGE